MIISLSNVYILKVVDRGSETQLQVCKHYIVLLNSSNVN